MMNTPGKHLLLKSLLALTLMSSSMSVLADDSYFAPVTNWWNAKTWRPVVALGVGTSTSSTVGQTQTLPITDPITGEFAHYQAYRPGQTSTLGDVFLGGEWQLTPVWALQGGLDYSASSAFSAKGVLTQGADQFSADSFNYSYNVTARQVMAEAKLLYAFRNIYHPYALVGVGSSFNRAFNYKTTVPPFITFTRQYSDYTNWSFTYSVGVGIDVDVYHNVRLGLGYRFADLGASGFSGNTIDNVSASNSMTQAHIYSNQVLGQISWVLQ